jgi:hypothetical protein
LSSDEEKDKCEINDRLKELLHLEKNWWNPINKFKIPGVREEVRQLEMRQREKTEEEYKIKKNIIVRIINDEDVVYTENREITRKQFEDLIYTKLVSLRIKNSDDRIYSIGKFDELVNGQLYDLLKTRTIATFDGFAKIEGKVQTRDCVQSIIDGNLKIPGFDNLNNAMVYFEYDISPPKKNRLSPEILGFGFPIVPDAVLISEDEETWVIMECKHNFTNSRISLFLNKVNYIIENKDKNYVKKGNVEKTPTKIIAVVCSISDFSKIIDYDSSKVVKVIRNNLGYKII